MTSNHFKIKSNPRMSIDENNNRDKFNLFPISHLPDIHESKRISVVKNKKINKSIDFENNTSRNVNKLNQDGDRSYYVTVDYRSLINDDLNQVSSDY